MHEQLQSQGIYDLQYTDTWQGKVQMYVHKIDDNKRSIRKRVVK